MGTQETCERCHLTAFWYGNHHKPVRMSNDQILLCGDGCTWQNSGFIHHLFLILRHKGLSTDLRLWAVVTLMGWLCDVFAECFDNIVVGVKTEKENFLVFYSIGVKQRCHRRIISCSVKNQSIGSLTFFIIWRSFFHHKEPFLDAFVKQKCSSDVKGLGV